MKSASSLVFWAVLALSITAARAYQINTNEPGGARKGTVNPGEPGGARKGKKARTLTGCVQKGEDANEYNITSKDGGTWEIKSDSVKLDEHVGHEVKITGVVSNATAHGMKEDVKQEMKEHGMDKHATEHGHMTVTDLTVVSDTCQK